MKSVGLKQLIYLFSIKLKKLRYLYVKFGAISSKFDIFK